ncbi:hypothetical protein ZWY2020_059496 [Hordeum vulgare]|nr:hypothetical protein ZWY2020_059496 [Hordeum vulgare]
MEKKLGKRTIEIGGYDLKGKRPHVDGEAESDDDDFVLANVLRNAHSSAIRKDFGTSKGQHKCRHVDGGVDVVPKKKLKAGKRKTTEDDGDNDDDVCFNKDGLKNTMSSYSQLKHEKCSRFGKDDEHIINDMDQEDTTADAYSVGVETCDIVASQDNDIAENSCEGVDKDENLADASFPHDVVADNVWWNDILYWWFAGNKDEQVHEPVGVVRVDDNEEGRPVAGDDNVKLFVSATPEFGPVVAPNQHEDVDVLRRHGYAYVDTKKP